MGLEDVHVASVSAQYITITLFMILAFLHL